MKAKTPKKYKKNKKLEKLNNIEDIKLNLSESLELSIHEEVGLQNLLNTLEFKNLYNLEALAVENSRQIDFLEALIGQWQIAQKQLVDKFTEQLNKSDERFEKERAIRNEVVRTYNNFVHFGQLADPEDIKKWNKDLPEGFQKSEYVEKTKLLESGKTSTSIKEKKKK